MIKLPGMRGWPTLCRVCRRWQRAALCSGCVAWMDTGRHRCERCALPLPAPGRCRPCEDDPPAFDNALALLDYAAPWTSLIAAVKFKDDVALAGHLAALLAKRVQARWSVAGRGGNPHAAKAPLAWKAGAPTLVVPVPLGPARLRERGYNQAGLLARGVARRLGRPLAADALVRTRDIPRLMTLQADERLRYIRGVFAVNPARQPLVEGRHVALVDDVLTTGATLGEAARVLWQAGASEVSVWVVARTPPSHPVARSPTEDEDAGEPGWKDTELLLDRQ